VVPARVDRTACRQREKALRLLGFASFVPGLWVRPDNLTVRAAELRVELIALGLPDADLVVGLHDFDPVSERRAHGLWDVPALRRGYRRSLADVEASAARLGKLAPTRAMAESFLLGGRVVRELVLDPLLPDEICPGDERRALVERLGEYDRAGRLVWAALMERWGLPFRRAPVDARADEERGRAAAG